MSKIPQNIIDQVRDTAEIYEIVSEYVDLKQRGNNFFGLCPFHDEKTPYASVVFVTLDHFCDFGSTWNIICVIFRVLEAAWNFDGFYDFSRGPRS